MKLKKIKENDRNENIKTNNNLSLEDNKTNNQLKESKYIKLLRWFFKNIIRTCEVRTYVSVLYPQSTQVLGMCM